MPAVEVRVEHCYPEASDFVRRHGPQALAVLHDLLPTWTGNGQVLTTVGEAGFVTTAGDEAR